MRSSDYQSKLGFASRTALMLAAATLCASAWAQASPEGRWITASGNLEVNVTSCGTALCGVVTKVLANKSMSRGGEEMKPVDTRPALGMTILSDFKPDEMDDKKPVRWHGEIYNRENGKTYSCQMSLGPQGELVLHPYVVLPLFGKTQLWQRATTAPAQTSEQH